MEHKILVVDDDDDIRFVLVSVLAPLGEVLEASGGEAALRLLKDEKPAIMLLDVSMPQMSGLAVLKAARMRAPSLIVMMLTAESSLSIAKIALERGARSYVTKPFDPEALREEVGRHLGLAVPPPYRPWRMAC